MPPTLDTAYPANPWQGVATKERTPWYYPVLYDEFKRHTTYNRFVGMEFNHNGPTATELRVTSLTMPNINHTAIGNRDMWVNASSFDSFERKITFQRYANKMQFNRYDDLITYWQYQGVKGLEKIIRNGSGFVTTRQMDRLARDAFFKMPFKMFGDGSGGFSGSNFAAIDSSDKVTTRLLEDVRLGLKERDVPIAVDEMGPGGTIWCITSPGVVSDLRFEASAGGNANAFIDVMKYANPQSIVAGETGTYHNTRFIETPDAILYNCGAITVQSAIKSPITAGDGTPNPATTAVDGIEYVGQTASQHFVDVLLTTGFNVGDFVTIHVNRTSANGVTNGVDHTDGKLHNRRIVSIDATAHTLTFDRPIMEDFSVDLGGTVYGYVTKATHIHSMTFLTGANAVVMGVAQPPQIRMPRPFDDLEMVYRVVTDFYMGWQPFEKNSAEVVYLAGSNRQIGGRY